MKQNIRKWLVAAIAVLTLLCLIFIFSNSLKDSSESSEQSFAVRDMLAFVASVFGFDGEINVSKLRNFAHVAEFFALGVCLSAASVFLAKRKGTPSGKKLALHLLGAVGVGVCVAVIDELLQLFSEGRACELKDGLLDTLGIVLGSVFICVAYLVWNLIRTRKLNKKSQTEQR